MFTMELILATVFSQDVNLSSESENPLARVPASIFEYSAGTGNRARLEKLITIISHFPRSEPILKYFASRNQGNSELGLPRRNSFKVD